MRLSRSQKRIRLTEESVDRDRLSELPDEIIVRILSCLPTVEAVRTVLLRRFGNLWTLIHNLHFDVGEFLINNCCHLPKGGCKHIGWFYRFIHNIRMRHQNPSIERFHLRIERVNLIADIDIADMDITTWWSFALCLQAKEISISDDYCCELCYTSILPKFASQFLVTLKLEFCKFEGELQVELRSLRKLSLNRVWMSDENFKRFISGCPSLQELVISNPVEMTKLRLSNPNIDKLSLVLTDRRWGIPVLLYFPNLKNLYLEVKKWWPLDIVDVSSVRNIYIKHLNFILNSNHLVLASSPVLLEKFKGIEVFRLSCKASKDFLHSVTKLQLLQCKWTRIDLELRNFCQCCLFGIYHLMKSLEHLEELFIYTTEDFETSGLFCIELPSSDVMPQLKTISLYGYRKSWKSQLQLVELLFGIAAALDKLIMIPMNYQLEEEDELEVVRLVSSIPRASPTVRVIFPDKNGV